MGFFDKFNRAQDEDRQRAQYEDRKRAQDEDRKRAQDEDRRRAQDEMWQSRIGVIIAQISEKEAQIKRIRDDYLKSLTTVSERDNTISNLHTEIDNLNREKKEISDKHDKLYEINIGQVEDIVYLTDEKNTAVKDNKKKQIALYTAILSENLVLEKEMDKLKGEHTTDYRKVNY